MTYKKNNEIFKKQFYGENCQTAFLNYCDDNKIYTIYFNSCMLFGHNNITFEDCKPLPVTLKTIKRMQEFPHIYATNIKYKIQEIIINIVLFVGFPDERDKTTGDFDYEKMVFEDNGLQGWQRYVCFNLLCLGRRTESCADF